MLKCALRAINGSNVQLITGTPQRSAHARWCSFNAKPRSRPRAAARDAGDVAVHGRPIRRRPEARRTPRASPSRRRRRPRNCRPSSTPAAGSRGIGAPSSRPQIAENSASHATNSASSVSGLMITPDRIAAAVGRLRMPRRPGHDQQSLDRPALRGMPRRWSTNAASKAVALRDGRHQRMFMISMRAAAHGTEPVQGRSPGTGGEVAVRSATDLGAAERIKAQVAGQPLSQREQRSRRVPSRAAAGSARRR